MAYLNETFREQNLNSFLEQRKQTGMMNADAFTKERQHMLHLTTITKLLLNSKK